MDSNIWAVLKWPKTETAKINIFSSSIHQLLIIMQFIQYIEIGELVPESQIYEVYCENIQDEIQIWSLCYINLFWMWAIWMWF